MGRALRPKATGGRMQKLNCHMAPVTPQDPRGGVALEAT